MKIINAINRALTWVEGSLIVALLSIMVVLAFFQVVLRNVFESSFLWADPLLRYMVMWVGFLGATLATRQEKHFGVDIIDRFLPLRALHVSRIVIYAFAATVAFLLTSAAVDFLTEAIGAEELDLFDLPKRLYFAIIPAGFALIGIHFLLHIARHVRDMVAGEPPAREPVPPQTIF